MKVKSRLSIVPVSVRLVTVAFSLLVSKVASAPAVQLTVFETCACNVTVANKKKRRSRVLVFMYFDFDFSQK